LSLGRVNLDTDPVGGVKVIKGVSLLRPSGRTANNYDQRDKGESFHGLRLDSSFLKVSKAVGSHWEWNRFLVPY